MAEKAAETVTTSTFMHSTVIDPADIRYPAKLRLRGDGKALPALHILGNANLLELPKTGLFCSSRCPGIAILQAYDMAARWRDTDRCIISGFHSPVEQECLRILLRGSSPVILCPARGLPKRIPTEWQDAIAADRLLILSIFADSENRISAAHASQRNDIVAALADDVWFAHIAPGGETDRLSHRLHKWGVPFLNIEKE